MPTALPIVIPHVEARTLDTRSQDARHLQIDGHLTEPAWASAAALTQFLADYPKPDSPPTGQTEVKLFSTSEGLYFAVIATDPEPNLIRAGLGRRDSRSDDDQVTLYLDPSGDAQRAYAFTVNPLGVQSDAIQLGSDDWGGIPWDGLWFSAGHLTSTGYEVEGFIPWRILRRPTHASAFGLLITRSIARLDEWSNWPRVDPDVQGTLVHEALISLAQPPSTRARGLDITPELTFGLTSEGSNLTGQSPPFLPPGLSPGLTLRYLPTPASSVLATVNPDYSQVEADAAIIDVNRRFAQSFDEKRPFFLEGQEWFSHPIPDLIYTRSMVQPLLGLRATAELNRTSLGVLQVLDASPDPSVLETGGWSPELVEGHAALDSILRVRRDIGEDGYAGLLLSHKWLTGTQAQNLLAGGDGRLRLSDTLLMSGALLGSFTTDADAHAQSAPAARVALQYASKHWKALGSAQWIGPGFQAENGFLTRNDRLEATAQSGYSFFPSWEWLPRLELSPLSLVGGWNSAGELQDMTIAPELFLAFGNGASGSLYAHHIGERLATEWLDYDRVGLTLNGRFTRAFSLNLELSTGTAPFYDAEVPFVGWMDAVWSRLTLQLGSRVYFAAEGGWERFLVDNALIYQGLVATTRLETFWTPQLMSRLRLEYSSFEPVPTLEALLGWELAPGRAMYLGTSFQPASNDAADPASEAAAWQLFTKASWVFLF